MNRKVYTCSAVLVLILASLSHCNLAVYNLQALGKSNPALENIAYSIANFGFAP
jgi:hypothetical protein